MIDAIEIRTARGLDIFKEYFRTAEERAEKASLFAVNDAAEFGRVLASRYIRGEINFTAGYLASEGRLAIVKRATGTDLEAVVRGRDRPTMLSRFATTPKRFGRQARVPRIKVLAKGGTSSVKNSFFVPLNNGNIGLAVRLRPGQRIPGKNVMASTRSGLYILYGPSVGQVARSAFPEVSDRVGEKLQERFLHHFQRFE